jgi:hypothetical protein
LLTLERIIDAGIHLVDKQGFEALTMRRVAESLNSGVMSLYWYVENREELASVVVDALLRRVPTPPSDMPWSLWCPRHSLRSFIAIDGCSPVSPEVWRPVRNSSA